MTFNQLMRHHRITRDIIDSDRVLKRDIVRWKRFLKDLRAKGHSYPAIGRLVKRDHKTIMQHLKGAGFR